MAALHAAFLAFLLAASFTDTVQLNVTTVDRLVDYKYDLGFERMLPSMRYNGSITADWAVPASALRGLEGRAVAVSVRASAANDSPIAFPSVLGFEQKSFEAVLRCDVGPDSACMGSSVLSARIPVVASSKPDAAQIASITLVSEIAEGSQLPQVDVSAGSIISTISGALSQNASNASSGQKQANGNFLDSLKPEGDSRDPVTFLRENPVISLLALVIVIAITGAYLLNVKD
jgi:hypothetical protein